MENRKAFARDGDIMSGEHKSNLRRDEKCLTCQEILIPTSHTMSDWAIIVSVFCIATAVLAVSTGCSILTESSLREKNTFEPMYFNPSFLTS